MISLRNYIQYFCSLLLRLRMKSSKRECNRKRKTKPLCWEEQLSRQIQFVDVHPEANETSLAVDEESVDVTIIRSNSSHVAKHGGLRKPFVSKRFEAETVIDFNQLWVSGEDLLSHSSIRKHREAAHKCEAVI
ncbi:unnamed protein product [Trichobilharzia szidati]|nr:unnamed protein product [Trichobilharzia szidati]